MIPDDEIRTNLRGLLAGVCCIERLLRLVVQSGDLMEDGIVGKAEVST